MMKVFLLKRKLLTVLACALAAAAIFCAVHYPAAVSAAAADRQLPMYCVQRDQKMVAISFDAAWGDVILRTLGRKGSGAPTSAFLCRPAARACCCHSGKSSDRSITQSSRTFTFILSPAVPNSFTE